MRLSFAVAQVDDVVDPGREESPAAYYERTAHWNQRVRFDGVKPIIVYSTNWRYVVAGVVPTLLAAAAVLLLYRGWWRLGREPSLNPLVMALAFDAAQLRHLPSNANPARLTQRIGRDRVRYGVAPTHSPPPMARSSATADAAADHELRPGQALRLRFGAADRVETPVNGMRVG